MKSRYPSQKKASLQSRWHIASIACKSESADLTRFLTAADWLSFCKEQIFERSILVCPNNCPHLIINPTSRGVFGSFSKRSVSQNIQCFLKSNKQSLRELRVRLAGPGLTVSCTIFVSLEATFDLFFISV